MSSTLAAVRDWIKGVFGVELPEGELSQYLTSILITNLGELIQFLPPHSHGHTQPQVPRCQKRRGNQTTNDDRLAVRCIGATQHEDGLTTTRDDVTRQR